MQDYIPDDLGDIFRIAHENKRHEDYRISSLSQMIINAMASGSYEQAKQYFSYLNNILRLPTTINLDRMED